jgi:hypothetical protein
VEEAFVIAMADSSVFFTNIGIRKGITFFQFAACAISCVFIDNALAFIACLDFAIDSPVACIECIFLDIASGRIAGLARNNFSALTVFVIYTAWVIAITCFSFIVKPIFTAQI